ncbi:hypothetical protein [Nostocoides sp. Soil756]|uniref:hypothetical protein n=1 Tax=Nostocoides sp. Soil756 TaxID=1736399 RepID=UPI000700D8FD|nr:hypothetical protein [Tetrasphaera sp. Soil756]KRE62038.1 hypothetical protein ASG78_02925 [Tetrasphaera sp. Soil756]
MTLPVRRVLAVLILGAALVTTGCGSLQTNRAATVNGSVITEDEVRAVMTEVNSMQPALLQQKLTPSSALTALLRARPALAYFAENGIVASDSVATQEAQTRGVDDPSGATIEFIRFIDALNQAASSQKFTTDDEATLVQRISEQKVTVNPRYGVFDPTTAGVGVTPPPWVTAYSPKQ